jgi:flagellin FlaB
MKQDNAFTGLEAAIVLIAFVVVAAVFRYVLLGAGFFATQKAQEVTYAGIQQTTSNMFLVGQVYGDTTLEGSTRYLTTISLILGVPEGGQPQSAEELQLLFSNDE